MSLIVKVRRTGAKAGLGKGKRQRSDDVGTPPPTPRQEKQLMLPEWSLLCTSKPQFGGVMGTAISRGLKKSGDSDRFT